MRVKFVTLLILVIFAAQSYNLTGGAVSSARSVSSAPQGSSSMLVNSTGDEPDSTVGDGRCDTDGNPSNGDQCTLRAAIQEINVTPANVLNFNLPPNSTIILNTELEELTGMTINGPGSSLLTIKRNPAPGTPQFRIFTVTPPAAVLMTGLTITNGRAPDGPFHNGAPGGGIFNQGLLELRDVVVTGNRAGNGHVVDADHPTGGNGGAGGGIGSTGPLTLIDCVITENHAGDATYNNLGGGGGGVAAGKGGLIVNTVISNNVAGTGGVAEFGGSGGQAGGLATGFVITVINSSITGNRSGRGGDSTVAVVGGIGGDGGGISNTARATFVNVTVSDNQTGEGGTGTRESNLGGSGGGIHNTAAQLIITNCTITGNRTTGNYGGSGGGIYSPIFGNGILKNTIVANNLVAKGGARDGVGPDLNGNFTSQDYNLLKDISSASVVGVTTHNITGLDPKLGPLSNNGGRTLTHGLLPGSPAINAGSNANFEEDSSDLDGDGNLTEPTPFDQRGPGFPRILDGTVDMGAFEGVLQIVLPLQLALDNTGPAVDQLAAVDSMLLLRDPFRLTQPASVITQPTDGRTRVVIFVSNLNLAPTDPANLVTVTLVDAQGHSFEIAAENVRSVVGVEMSQVTFRLPDNLAAGTCTVKVSTQGRISNTGTIRIV